MTPSSNPIDPFEIHVEDEVIEDLIERISRTRWPGEITDSGWDYGSNLSYVMDLCDYWKNTFNWREQESRINTFQNFTTNVSGLNIHLDYVIVVTSKLLIRMERALKRGSLNREDILRRIDLQWPCETKVRMADFVIHNNTTEKKLASQVKEIYRQLT